jgi:hypothetical protein
MPETSHTDLDQVHKEHAIVPLACPLAPRWPSPRLVTHRCPLGLIQSREGCRADELACS